MNHLPPNLARFLRGVHRRLLLLRILESAGIGAAIASALALLLCPILLYRQQSALAPSLLLLSLGLLLGLVASLLRLPPIMHAAIEADRQLDLADLLSTSLTLDSPSPSSFASAVVATADAKCRSLPPSTVILNRLGARAWSGIGLSAALVIALALLSANPAGSRADGNLAATSPQASAQSTLPDRPREITSSASQRNPAPITRDQPDNERSDPTATASADGAPDHQRESSPAQARDRTAAGSAKSPISPSPDPATLSSTSSRAADTGEAASGVGTASPIRPSARADASSAAAGASQPLPRTAPVWTSPRWTDAQRRADDAIRSNSVPPEYYDLMRAYFARQ